MRPTQPRNDMIFTHTKSTMTCFTIGGVLWTPIGRVSLLACILAIPLMVMVGMDDSTAHAIVYGGVVESTVALSKLILVGISFLAFLFAATHNPAAACALGFKSFEPLSIRISILRKLVALASRLGNRSVLPTGGCALSLHFPTRASALRTTVVPERKVQLVDCWTSGPRPRVLYQ